MCLNSKLGCLFITSFLENEVEFYKIALPIMQVGDIMKWLIVRPLQKGDSQGSAPSGEDGRGAGGKRTGSWTLQGAHGAVESNNRSAQAPPKCEVQSTQARLVSTSLHLKGTLWKMEGFDILNDTSHPSIKYPFPRMKFKI